MDAKNNIYGEFLFLGYFLKFMDRHPVIANIILLLEGLALVWAVFTYEFTIPAYK